MVKERVAVLSAVLFSLMNCAWADDAEVVAAKFVRSGASWIVHVTLRHNDTGWDHYADAWRVMDEKGNEITTRVLYHPHVDEQPFTRSQPGVNIPKGVNIVYIEAHDKGHDWAAKRLRVDLRRNQGEGYEITRKP